MTTSRVDLWGTPIGAVTWDSDRALGFFEYHPDFVPSGIQVAPLTMPLSGSVYSFPGLGIDCFHGLPGMLADVLPDRFGNALIHAWLASQGRTPESFNPVQRLCYTGSRGMGALEFTPQLGPQMPNSREIQIDQLVELASEVLTARRNLQVSFADATREQAITDILRVGTSAGGARAKAVIAWNPLTNEVRSGQVEAGKGFECWLLKFDGVKGNRDKELDDPRGYGAIEYAYANMARDCGIDISECRLFEENGRRHFMTRRFDRLTDGEKLHMQSLGAMAHYDFNQAGAYAYEQALLVIRQLELPMHAIEQQFRRMAFNIIARNQDDHVKNIAFLMDKQGIWSLAPAFDMTYSYNPSGDWTASHQMTLNGKRDDFVMADFAAAAKGASMQRGRAKAIVNEVQGVVAGWQDYARDAGVPSEWAAKIHAVLRVATFA